MLHLHIFAPKRVFTYMHYKTLFLGKHSATPTLDICHFMYTVMDFTENVTKKCANRDKTALNFHWRFLISDKCCTALSASLYMGDTVLFKLLGPHPLALY